MSGHSIESLLTETRTFPPPAEFAAKAIAGPELTEAAKQDRLGFWADQARGLLHWEKPFTEVLDWTNPPFARWFADGNLNVAYNCLDRHVEAGNGDRVAFHWEGEPGDTRAVTYAELTAEVKRAANALEALGIGQGDRVAIYMPMIPEAVVAMLAVARLGAVHSVVFGGFSAESLRNRIDDAQAQARHHRRRRVAQGQGVPTEGHRGCRARRGRRLDRARARRAPRGERDRLDRRARPVVARRAGEGRPRTRRGGVEAENPLFILYTSGTTGKPKGILHTSGGYLTQVAFTHRNVFDLHAETDVYWCTADIGWVTGHSYVVYGPLANGATSVLYEGTPDTPHPGRWWELIQKYGVTILYTAPTAIRTFMKVGREVPDGFDLSSLRLIGSVGEPINPEAWIWYREVIGGGTTPVVDTWWQTETGAIMISALPGITALKPGSAQVPLPGIRIDILAEDGTRVDPPQGGYLTVTEPWPSMLRGIWGDPERYKETYWAKYSTHDVATYFAGDGAHVDADGDIWLAIRGQLLNGPVLLTRCRRRHPHERRRRRSRWRHRRSSTSPSTSPCTAPGHPDAAQHRRPRLRHREVPALRWVHPRTVLGEDVDADARQRHLRAPWLERGDARQGPRS